MIIGPNGTGKSTVVCAICLGLGSPTSTLGRAKDVGEFVKNGHQQATIEIELKAGPIHNGRNQVVRRVIKREGNKSIWFLNGHQTTHKNVVKLMKYFRIQIDNLCQFLPQDRVVEFARLTPIELLEQTQMAVASDEVAGWHQQLKTFGARRKALAVEKDTISQNLTELVRRQNQQQDEVDRMQQRDEMEQRRAVLVKARPIVKYHEKKRLAEEAQQVVKNIGHEISALKAHLNEDEINEKQYYAAQIERVCKQRKTVLSGMRRTVDSNQTKLQKNKADQNDCEGTIKAVASERGKAVKEIAKHEAACVKIQTELKKPAPEFDPAQFNNRINTLTHEIRVLKGDAQENLQLRINDAKQSIREKFEESKSLKQRIERLGTQAGQMERKLEQLSKDSFHAWQWLQQPENEALFEGAVHGPPIVTCSIKNRDIASAVEANMSRGNYITFTATSKRDYHLLTDRLTGGKNKGGLSLSDIYIQQVSRKLSEFKPPMEKSELSRLGFDKWLLDGIEGPDEVLAMLCETIKVHMSPYRQQKLSPVEHERMENSGLRSWTTEEGSFLIKQRAEYRDARIVNHKKLQAPRFFGAQPFDHSDKSRLEDAIRELNEYGNEEKKSLDALQEEMARLNSTLKEKENELVSLVNAMVSLLTR